jgi:hypothetical protein
MKHFFYLLSFFSFCTCVRAQDVWNTLKPSETDQVIFIAFEESEALKKHIGQWLPKQIYQVNGEPVRWCLVELFRKNDRATLKLAIAQANGEPQTLEWSWFNKGNDGAISYTITESEGLAYVSIPQGISGDADTSRRLMLMSSESIQMLNKSITISEASVMWSWEKARKRQL